MEDLDFAYTQLSLNDVYKLGLKHALQVVERNGGKINGDQISILCQQPEAVNYEHSFEGHSPVDRLMLNKQLNQLPEIKFDDIGLVVRDYVQCPDEKYVARVDAFVDGKKVENISLPVASSSACRVDLFWKYQLAKENT